MSYVRACPKTKTTVYKPFELSQIGKVEDGKTALFFKFIHISAGNDSIVVIGAAAIVVGATVSVVKAIVIVVAVVGDIVVRVVAPCVGCSKLNKEQGAIKNVKQKNIAVGLYRNTYLCLNARIPRNY